MRRRVAKATEQPRAPIATATAASNDNDDIKIGFMLVDDEDPYGAANRGLRGTSSGKATPLSGEQSLHLAVRGEELETVRFLLD